MFIKLYMFQRQLVLTSKQNVLDADPRAIEQIVFQGKIRQKLKLYTILCKIKRNNLRILKRNNKGFVRVYILLNAIK